MDKKNINEIEIWNESLFLLSQLSKSGFDNEKYYHYTNIDGVLGIFSDYIKRQTIEYINSKQNVPIECCFYASNIRFLNDGAEYREGEQFLIDKSIRFKNVAINESIYSISFCGNFDVLSQWKWYGKNSGIAIEFDLDNIEYQWYKVEDATETELQYDNSMKAITIKYARDDKEKFFLEILDKLAEKQAIDRVSETKLQEIKKVFIPFCKNHGFHEEKESRLVFYTYDRSTSNSCQLRCNEVKYPIYLFDIQYRTGTNGVAKPTLLVRFRHKKRKSLIKSLTVGPGQNQQLIFNALIHIFDREKYHFYVDEDINNDIKSDYNYYLANEDGSPSNGEDVQYWTHRCQNGIIIRKSAIPFRD